MNAEVTDVQLSLNDQVLLFSLMDNSIVLYHTHFDSMGTPEAITTVNIHNNIITSLALDNSYIENKNIKSVQNIYIDEMSYLTKVIKFYVKKGCLISNKKNCSKSYPNVHFHSVDYRFSNLCKPVEKIQNIIETLFILMFYLILIPCVENLL